MIEYTGRNGMDLLLASGAWEMEEDFNGDEIMLTLRDGRTLTLNRGDSLLCPKDGCSVVKRTSGDDA